MKNNNLVITILVAVIAVGVGFFGGMQYQKNQRPNFANGQFGNFQGRQLGQNGQGRGNLQGMRPVAGEIMSQDDKSVTVKMQDGSTKIIILSDKTVINKATTGSKSDLKTGEKVSVFGTQNTDGSVTAQNIAIGGGMLRPMPTETQK